MAVSVGMDVLLGKLTSKPPQKLQASTRLSNRASRRAQVSRRFRARKDTKGTLLQISDLAEQVVGPSYLSSFTRLHQILR